jgi:hypothetical protein
LCSFFFSQEKYNQFCYNIYRHFFLLNRDLFACWPSSITSLVPLHLQIKLSFLFLTTSVWIMIVLFSFIPPNAAGLETFLLGFKNGWALYQLFPSFNILSVNISWNDFIWLQYNNSCCRKAPSSFEKKNPAFQYGKEMR